MHRLSMTGYYLSIRVAARLALSMALLAPLAQAQAATPGIDLVGINVAGAEFTHKALPGKAGHHYFYPERRHFEYYQEKGIRLVRFPFIWERVQHNLGEPLNAEHVQRLRNTLDLAAEHEVKVILDMHNYARYKGELIGTGQVSYAAFGGVWRALAETLRGHPALYGYDIMNEPHNTAGLWPGAAQEAVDAIREVDDKTLIFVEGDHWANSWRWPQINPGLHIEDPAGRIVYEAHLYFDENFSGKYHEAEEVDPMLGVERVKPFIAWLKEHGYQGFLGEYGVPDDSPTMLVAMDNLLAYLNEHCIPSAYWAGGPGWGNYKLDVEPRNGQDRPQMEILQKHIANDCTDIGPAR